MAIAILKKNSPEIANEIMICSLSIFFSNFLNDEFAQYRLIDKPRSDTYLDI